MIYQKMSQHSQKRRSPKKSKQVKVKQGSLLEAVMLGKITFEEADDIVREEVDKEHGKGSYDNLFTLMKMTDAFLEDHPDFQEAIRDGKITKLDLMEQLGKAAHECHVEEVNRKQKS